MAAVEAMVEVVTVVGVMVGPLEEAQRLLSSKCSPMKISKQIIIISGFTGGQHVPVTPVLVRRDKSIIAQKDIKVGEVAMVEEVVTGRTIATEAWKESTVLAISASARLDLVCSELALEAVLVIMVVSKKETFFLHESKNIIFFNRRWRLWGLQWRRRWRWTRGLLWEMTDMNDPDN